MQSAYICFENKSMGATSESTNPKGPDQDNPKNEFTSSDKERPSELGAAQSDGPNPNDRQKLSSIIEMLEKIAKIKKMMTYDDSLQLKDFKFFIRTNKSTKGSKGPQQQHITQWGIYCLNPSYVFKQIVRDPDERPLSVILTSGTLQPFKILYQELKTSFKVKHVNEHFIDDSQVFATVINRDSEGNEFKFNFENKDMQATFR